MKHKSLRIKILVLAIAFTVLACQKNQADSLNISPSPAIIPIPAVNPNLSSNTISPIGKIDFKNFRYPNVYADFSGIGISELENESKLDFFELKNGKTEQAEEEDGAILQSIEYGDVTNDGEDEAIINISPVTGGNCSCNMVYVYTFSAGKPKLLWAFGTWDRAEGGLKRAYAENGELIVETFGENKFENDKWEFSFPQKNAGGYCCPTAYTKIRFKWNGEKFVAEGKPELFDYDWKKEMNKNRESATIIQ